MERCGSGVCCGIDIGGTDIKAAVAVDGRLVCVKEYDWNPAASLVAEGITGPIVLLVQLMALLRRRNDTGASGGAGPRTPATRR